MLTLCYIIYIVQKNIELIMIFYTEEFKRIRQEKGLSIQDLSKQSNISRTSIWAWENGKRIPSAKMVKSLAYCLNITTEIISDLAPDIERSDTHLDSISKSWLSLADTEVENQLINKDLFLKNIEKIYDDISQSKIIINSILSYLPTMFYIKDSGLRFLTANKMFLDTYGYKNIRGTIVGRKDDYFFSKKDAEANYKQDLDVLTKGKAIINHKDYIPGTRKKRWGLISKYPIFDIHNRVAGVIGTFLDITEQRLAEEVHEILAININSMREGFTVYDLERKKYVFRNKAIEDIFGYPFEIINNRDKWLEICVHDNDKELMQSYIKKSSWPTEYVYRINKPESGIRWIKTRTYKDILYRGKSCHISMDVDITEEKENNVDIGKQYLNSMDEGLLILDKHSSKVEFISKQTESILGLEKLEYDIQIETLLAGSCVKKEADLLDFFKHSATGKKLKFKNKLFLFKNIRECEYKQKTCKMFSIYNLADL